MELLCYTREPEDDRIYGTHLACSMHLAWRGADGTFRPFHHNEGILYAKAVQREDGTLEAKCLRDPWIFAAKDGAFGVLAVRTGEKGEEDPESEGCILLWKTQDFVHYEELGLLRLQEQGSLSRVRGRYDEKAGRYRIRWTDPQGIRRCAESEDLWTKKLEGFRVVEAEECEHCGPAREELEGISGVRPGNTIEIPEEKGDYLCRKLLVPECTGVELKYCGSEETMSCPDQIRAVAFYSDGTSVERSIDWTREKDGRLRGRIHQEHFEFPFAVNRADPCCMYRDGKYYFIATNDADGNHTLYLRRADSLSAIPDAKEHLILDSSTYPEIGGLLWAPEFHEIQGELYLFHAATEGEFFREESRVMELRTGGDPRKASDWSRPHLVVRKDGTPLCDAGNVISLDMTTFAWKGEHYIVWSQRQFLPVDQGAWLYIARIDAQKPWQLTTDPVCIAKPEYSWENHHTYVVEGPYALWNGEKLMLTYSGAAIDETYTVGMLIPDLEGDLLDPASWRKNQYPLMSSRSVEGEYGPGHNSYLTDEHGLVWNFYHAHPGMDAPRSSGARRVHFDIDGEPMLDLPEELDLPERLREVTLP